MNQKLPLSVFIIAKNEEDRIYDSIKSVVDWVDEVIVIDSGSGDDTVNIARDAGAKTYFKEWEGYGKQKSYGESLCHHDWVLNIDADERISSNLKNEIYNLFNSKNLDLYNGYRMKVVIMHHRFRPLFLRFNPHNWCLRLYNRNDATYKTNSVHDSVIFKKSSIKKVKKLNGLVYHYSFRSYAHAVEKINFYSTMQAEDIVKKGRKILSVRIIFEPFYSFIKAYIFRCYFLWGTDGIIEATIYAFARTLRLAKAIELYNKKKRDGFTHKSK